MPNKTLAFLIVIVLVGAGAYVYLAQEKVAAGGTGTETDSTILSEPTDFASFGVISAPAPSTGQATMSFSYLESGATTTKELQLDALSVCAAPNGATPCMAMSSTFDIPFDGKRAVVEGLHAGDAIIVRKLAVVAEDQLEYTPEIGHVFVSWSNARELITSCNANMVMQTHALDVFLTREDGSRVRSVEPVIDEVFRVLEDASGRCGSIPVATE